MTQVKCQHHPALSLCRNSSSILCCSNSCSSLWSHPWQGVSTCTNTINITPCQHLRSQLHQKLPSAPQATNISPCKTHPLLLGTRLPRPKPCKPSFSTASASGCRRIPCWKVRDSSRFQQISAQPSPKSPTSPNFRSSSLRFVSWPCPSADL